MQNINDVYSETKNEVTVSNWREFVGLDIQTSVPGQKTEHIISNLSIDGAKKVRDGLNVILAEIEKSKAPVKPAPNSVSGMARQILDHLKKVGSISAVEAQALYKCRSLSRRICDLKDAGFKVVSELKYDTTGQRYARYSLA